MDWIIWVLTTGLHLLAAWQIIGVVVFVIFTFYTAPFNPLGYAKIWKLWTANPIKGVQNAWWSALFWPFFTFGIITLLFSHWKNKGVHPIKFTRGAFIFWWEFLVTDRLREQYPKVEVLKPESHDDRDNGPGL